MEEVKVRIVGSKEFCQLISEGLRVIAAGNGWKFSARDYPRSPTRYSRTPKADHSIYVRVRRW